MLALVQIPAEVLVYPRIHGVATAFAPMPSLMRARLIESAEVAEGIRHFVFEAPDMETLDFIPGQFVSFTAFEKSGKSVTRAYSIASPPAGTNRFELCVTFVDDRDFSPHLFDMKPGDAMEMQVPAGHFVLRTPPRETILVATGTGIAPFRSMLKAYVNATSPHFTLLYGARHESHILYRAEFEELERRFPHFHFRPVLSRPESGWRGRTGYVQAHLAEATGGRSAVDVLLCGLKTMVEETRHLLKETGFANDQILFEKYD